MNFHWKTIQTMQNWFVDGDSKMFFFGYKIAGIRLSHTTKSWKGCQCHFHFGMRGYKKSIFSILSSLRKLMNEREQTMM